MALFDDGYQVMIGKDAVNTTQFAEKYRESLTDNLQPFSASSRRKVEKLVDFLFYFFPISTPTSSLAMIFCRVVMKGKSSFSTQLLVALSRTFKSRYQRRFILEGLVKFVVSFLCLLIISPEEANVFL